MAENLYAVDFARIVILTLCIWISLITFRAFVVNTYEGHQCNQMSMAIQEELLDDINDTQIFSSCGDAEQADMIKNSDSDLMSEEE